MPAATALDNAKVTAALQDFAQGGGVVVITPFTAYMDENGVFRGDGFAANLRELTGGLVRTIRWMGWRQWARGRTRRWSGKAEEWRGYLRWDWKAIASSWKSIPGSEIIATFKSRQPILNGKPAVTQRKLGRGTVVKLGFWPGDDSFLRLIRQLVPDSQTLLAAPLPAGVLAVPHLDNSLFIVNTTRQEMPVQLSRGAKDRLSETALNGTIKLDPFQVLWLE